MLSRPTIGGLSTVICILSVEYGSVPQPGNGLDGERMKGQYAGDVNDFRKYALLRHLSTEG